MPLLIAVRVVLECLNGVGAGVFISFCHCTLVPALPNPDYKSIDFRVNRGVMNKFPAFLHVVRYPLMSMKQLKI